MNQKFPEEQLSSFDALLNLEISVFESDWSFRFHLLRRYFRRHERYAPKLPNYCGSPVGRTFPSAAGIITSELFFTDDNGTYFFPTRDFHPEVEIHDGKVDLEDFVVMILRIM